MAIWRIMGHVEKVAFLIVMLGKAGQAMGPVYRKAKFKLKQRKEKRHGKNERKSHRS